MKPQEYSSIIAGFVNGLNRGKSRYTGTCSGTVMHLKFSVNQWALWSLPPNESPITAENVYTGKPSLDSLSGMVKRRMPGSAKAIQQLNDDHQWHQLPCVYASKHAELSRTYKIIRQFNQDLSPALFSMSVHNAIPGLLSVINHDDSVYTVIDSMSGVVEMAVTEAVSWLSQYPKVKVVYFEEDSRTEADLSEADKDSGMVLMMVIESGDDCTLSLESKSAENQELKSNESNQNVIQLVNLLTGKQENYQNPQPRGLWQWQRKPVL